MSHTCHAIECKKEIKPELLMCFKHWHMVPPDTQKSIWCHYRKGQCDDWSPSAEYCTAAKLAVEEVGKKEGRNITGEEPELTLYNFFSPS